MKSQIVGDVTMAFLHPLNPIVHFWLHHIGHCPEKIVSAHYACGSASAERVGQGEVGGVTCRVTCTRWRLGLAVKAPWLGQFLLWLHGQTKKTLLSPSSAFISGREGCLGSEQVFDNRECSLFHAC